MADRRRAGSGLGVPYSAVLWHLTLYGVTKAVPNATKGVRNAWNPMGDPIGKDGSRNQSSLVRHRRQEGGGGHTLKKPSHRPKAVNIG